MQDSKKSKSIKSLQVLRSNIIGGLFILLICSCSPRVTQPVTLSDTTYIERIEYRDRILKDTIYEKESEKIYTLHDTVFVDKTKYIYKQQLSIDTVYVSKVDSIFKEVPIETKVEVVKKVYPKWLIILSTIAIIYLILQIKKFFT